MSENIKNSIYSDYFKIIQDTINRMGKNSFLLKAWTVTIIAGISIFTFNFLNTIIFTVLIGIVLIFWVLDSYYLRTEKLFRKLYEKNVEDFNDQKKRNKIRLFDMKQKAFENDVKKILGMMFSRTEGLFYISLIMALTLLLVINVFF